ncbi:hypothetical protein SARC_10933 [Sphaeroforma arctica JP610]|uniref:MI domain-containing protein n=1 Tax=Sphaeroforma arctica JP610 TaxID=667725 RepID=A0A0L0FIK9_9EUKA|nr:hypothetical protein SARC_10933 [Sphaeroforma arctica JP610]KNC76575.1 hypothetical protein SARC_10933 [Sphaeroforma arctica JP610]|eukprot:XP_014150477.1 hypothetical protein SARC_10933 [Sphaeroforma arctica JP610]
MGRASLTHGSASAQGSAKKNGGGGKYTWGNLGDEYLGIPESDKGDPNHSDGDASVHTTSEYRMDEGHHTSYLPNDFREDVEPIIKEYFNSGDSGDVLESLQKLGEGEFITAGLLTGLSLAMERHRAERELISCLITDFVFEHKVANSAMIAETFQAMLYNIDELATDIPEVATFLGRFIARAVADDVIAPAFVTSNRVQDDAVRADEALSIAHKFLNMKHGYSRLENVWGVDGARRPIAYLREKMHDLLEEYVLSSDVDDLEKSLKELSVPHFNHELVYQTIVYSIEAKPDTRSVVMEKMSKVIGRLENDGFLSDDQINMGLTRAFADLEDLCLDVPDGKQVFQELTSLAVQDKWATDVTVEMARRRSSSTLVAQA